MIAVCLEVSPHRGERLWAGRSAAADVRAAVDCYELSKQSETNKASDKMSDATVDSHERKLTNVFER